MIRFKLMFGELAVKRTNVLRIDVSLCESSCDSGGLLEWRLLGFLCERTEETVVLASECGELCSAANRCLQS